MMITTGNTLVLSVLTSLLFFLFRYPLGRLFTSDPTVLSLFTGCIWIFLIQMPFDHLQTVLCRGILISFGKQRFIAISLSLICYLIATPLIAVFVFLTELGPLGILISFLTFAAINLVAAALKISSLSLDREIELSERRAGAMDNFTLCDSDDMDENAPLTSQNRKWSMDEKKVASLILCGVIFLGIMIYLSML